jgi:NAD(P)-dependent dehydrogenase (short-subunit alcohol dehydrogenase family)
VSTGDLRPNREIMKQKKQYVLITGASSGIGQVLAINLSREFDLILHGRDLEKLKHTKSLCSRDKEQKIFSLNLNDTDIIESSLLNFINENELEINHFIHSAGFMKMLPLKAISLQVINTTFSTNVISAALFIKVLSQRKINNEALKTVVFISSNISNFGAKAFNIYGASKGALDALMRSLAVELAPKVRVNSVLPGAIHTGMTKNIFENKEGLERIAKDYPLGLGDANDIFELVNFLLSEKAKWITGQQFTVDGGRTINITG